MFRITTILIVCLALTACASKKKVAEGETKEETSAIRPDGPYAFQKMEMESKTTQPGDSLFASIRRTPCFGKCPSYEIRVFMSGYCMYNGKQFTELVGFHSGRLTPKQMQGILDRAKEIDYFEMQDKYDAKITDVPTCFTSVQYNGRTKKIMNRWDGPEELKEYQNYFDKVLKTVDWKPVSGGQGH